MALQQVRANFPKDADGNPIQPRFVQQVDASGNLGSIIAGDIAAGVADSGNPVKIGGIGRNALGSAVANGQRVGASFGIYGQLFTSNAIPSQFPAADANANSAVGYQLDLSGGPAIPATGSVVFNGTTWDRQRGDANGISIQPALSSAFWSFAAATGGIVNTTTAVTIKAASGAGVRNYISAIQVSHDALGAVTELAIRDGAAGTVLWRGKLQTTANEGGGTIKFNPPLKGTANTLTEVVTLTAVTGGVFVNAQGYTGV